MGSSVASLSAADRFYGRKWPAKAATIGHGVEVRKSKLSNAGRGLFATERFEDGDWITEYGGEVIDHAECLRRRERKMDTHIRSLSPLHSAIDGLNVPATEGQGGASFANDPWSWGNEAAARVLNAEFVVIQSFDSKVGVKRDGLVVPERVFLRAIKPIAAGGEIYVNYGPGFWDRNPLF